ncbi:MAG: hypothetical protein ACXW02_07710 [Halobacteriota archaeon]
MITVIYTTSSLSPFISALIPFPKTKHPLTFHGHLTFNLSTSAIGDEDRLSGG